MIVDSQLHPYDPTMPEQRERLSAITERAAARGIAIPPAVTADELLAWMDAAGVGGAILTTFIGLYRFDNSYALDAAARHPDRFTVVGSFDPRSPDLDGDVAEFSRRPGAIGIRAFASSRDERAFFRDGGFDAYFAAAGKSGLAVFIFAPDELASLHRLADLHPKTPIVIDHMGINQPPLPDFDPDDPFGTLPALLELARHPNVAVKVSGVATVSSEPYPFADVWPAVHRVVDAFGANRLLWGSDSTRTRLDYREELDYVRESHELSPAERDLVLGGAFERLFGVPA